MMATDAKRVGLRVRPWPVVKQGPFREMNALAQPNRASGNVVTMRRVIGAIVVEVRVQRIGSLTVVLQLVRDFGLSPRGEAARKLRLPDVRICARQTDQASVRVIAGRLVIHRVREDLELVQPSTEPSHRTRGDFAYGHLARDHLEEGSVLIFPAIVGEPIEMEIHDRALLADLEGEVSPARVGEQIVHRADWRGRVRRRQTNAMDYGSCCIRVQDLGAAVEPNAGTIREG